MALAFLDLGLHKSWRCPTLRGKLVLLVHQSSPSRPSLVISNDPFVLGLVHSWTVIANMVRSGLFVSALAGAAGFLSQAEAKPLPRTRVVPGSYIVELQDIIVSL